MATGAAFVLLFLVLGVGGTILLWWFVERETDDPPRMSRAEAERFARSDTCDRKDE